jgi:hypothetical protein
MYSTYLGGGSFDEASSVLVDGAGDLIIVGRTFSTYFEDWPVIWAPTYPSCNACAGPDALVAKIDRNTNELEFVTNIGGISPEGDVTATLGNDGEIVIAGYTNSPDLASSPSAYQRNCSSPCSDGFIAKLTATGSLAALTYLGGTDYDSIKAVDVGPGGSIYVTGATRSADLPGTTGGFQPLCTSDDGAIVQPESIGAGEGSRVRIPDLRRGPGAQGPGPIRTFTHGGCSTDGFVTKLSPDLSTLRYSSYLGGNEDDVPTAIAVDASGSEVVVAGVTESANFPITDGNAAPSSPGYMSSDCANCPSSQEGFVARVSEDGSALVDSVFVGGGFNDSIAAIDLRPSGNVVVVGTTSSSDLAMTEGAYGSLPTWGGDLKGLIAEIDLSGPTAIFSARLAGAQVTSVASDESGFVMTGAAVSDLPTTIRAAQRSCANSCGGRDGFVARITDDGAALTYSTFLGGSDQDITSDVAVAGEGEVFVVGNTQSFDFPLSAYPVGTNFRGYQDMFLTGYGANEIHGGDFELDVTFDGEGAGSVARTLVGVTDQGDFERACHSYDEDDCFSTHPWPTANISLVATPSPGYEFAGWDGSCSSEPSSTCELSMTDDHWVGAIFEVAAAPTPSPSGSASASPSPSPSSSGSGGDPTASPSPTASGNASPSPTPSGTGGGGTGGGGTGGGGTGGGGTGGGGTGGGGTGGGGTGGGGTGGPTPTPTTTTSPSPTASPTASPTPSPSGVPTPLPTTPPGAGCRTDATVCGTFGDDVLTGTPGDDVIDGGGGNDQIEGGDGSDVLDGGAGDDAVGGGVGNDVIDGGEGVDQIDGGDGDDTLDGGAGDDSVSGGAGNDTLRGGDGNDFLIGGPGIALIWCGPGSDIARGGPGADVIRCGPGRDLMSGRKGRDRLFGQTGPDQALGGEGKDRIVGGTKRDQLWGGPGSDRLAGGPGRDVFKGESGRDTLVGSGGRDRLSGMAGRDRLEPGRGRDKVMGGSGIDRICGLQKIDLLKGRFLKDRYEVSCRPSRNSRRGTPPRRPAWWPV